MCVCHKWIMVYAILGIQFREIYIFLIQETFTFLYKMRESPFFYMKGNHLSNYYILVTNKHWKRGIIGIQNVVFISFCDDSVTINPLCIQSYYFLKVLNDLPVTDSSIK